MSLIKSFSVGEGDMFYICHNSDNFTIIDCCLEDESKKDIVDEVKDKKKSKGVSRFISTHPDEDHVKQLDYLDNSITINNFYCVKNEASKDKPTPGFMRYCSLRDDEDKHYFIEKDCVRHWMNKANEMRGSSGISILWPKVNNSHYKEALKDAKSGCSPNNISPIIKYSLENGVTAIWFGDLEKDFMEKIKNEISFQKINLVFAPHHGRKSGKIPEEWINKMDPDIIIMGEANSNDSDYASYPDYNKIRQNSAKDLIFDCVTDKVHIYSSNENYSVDFLDNEYQDDYDYYIGTLNL